MSDDIINSAEPPPTIAKTVPTFFTITLDNKEMVKIHGDGHIEFGPEYTPDAAAMAFWDAIAKSVPDLTAPPPAATPFVKDLARAINFHSRENASGTPDFILATLLGELLVAFERATVARDAWHQAAEPGPDDVLFGRDPSS